MAGFAFSKECKIVGVLDVLTTAASTSRAGYVVDTLGFNGCCFIFHNGTGVATAVKSFAVARSNVAASSTSLTGGQDILGTLQTLTATTDDDKIYYCDIAVLDDTERYLLLTCTKSTANGDESCIAILYNGSESPVTHGTGSGTSGGSGAVSGEFFTVTTEGTA